MLQQTLVVSLAFVCLWTPTHTFIILYEEMPPAPQWQSLVDIDVAPTAFSNELVAPVSLQQLLTRRRYRTATDTGASYSQPYKIRFG